jgi:uncharacterized Zn-binding protein involved in type VI secretion
MQSVIRQGDTLLPFGGQVLEGHYEYYGQPIACQGDAVLCNYHGVNAIAEGSTLFQADDCPVALHGHRCLCGCTLVSSMPDVWVAS